MTLRALVPASDVRSTAKMLIERGFQVVPLEPDEKACKDKGWMQLRFRPEDFGVNDNIGLRSVDGIVVSDADSAEAVALADAFLPPTRLMWDRPSKPRAKRVYRCAIAKTIVLKDHAAKASQKPVIVELRVEHQDMCPPSRHPSGEHLQWIGELHDPAVIDADALVRAHRLLATAAVTAHHYASPGERHEWTLALAGLLRAAGLSHSEARLVIEEAGRHAGDPLLRDRLLEIQTTFDRTAGQPVTGAVALRGIAGREFVTSIERIWRPTGKDHRGFIFDEKGKLSHNHQGNIRIALDKLEIRLSHNRFKNTNLLSRGDESASPIDDAALDSAWLAMDEQLQLRPSMDFFERVIRHDARQNSFHPVCDYLDSLKWDGNPRLDRWLIDCAGAFDSHYVRAVSALPLIAAVRRVRHPGCKFDEMLILESGQQGQQKSTALRELCANEEWFSDDLPLGADAKEIVERTVGKWLVEAPELKGNRQSEVERLKSFLSRSVDGPVRMAYARLSTEVRRQFVIIGTTNAETGYLKDSTGNRRFWPVRIERFDLDRLRGMRDQLWAEAAERESTGASIRLHESLYAAAAQQQEDRRLVDPWEELITDSVDLSGAPEHIEAQLIWDSLVSLASVRDNRHAERIASIMQRLGYPQKRRIRVEGNRKWVWMRADVAAQVELNTSTPSDRPAYVRQLQEQGDKRGLRTDDE